MLKSVGKNAANICNRSTLERLIFHLDKHSGKKERKKTLKEKKKVKV